MMNDEHMSRNPLTTRKKHDGDMTTYLGSSRTHAIWYSDNFLQFSTLFFFGFVVSLAS